MVLLPVELQAAHPYAVMADEDSVKPNALGLLATHLTPLYPPVAAPAQSAAQRQNA